MKNLYLALKAIVDSTLGGGIIKRKPDSEGYYSEPLHKNEMEFAQEALAECKALFEPDWSKVEPGTMIKVKDYDREPWAVREFHQYDSGKILCRTLGRLRGGVTLVKYIEWNIAEVLTQADRAWLAQRIVLEKLLELPEAKKALGYLHSGIGTATESAVWLEAEALINQGELP